MIGGKKKKKKIQIFEEKNKVKCYVTHYALKHGPMMSKKEQ